MILLVFVHSYIQFKMQAYDHDFHQHAKGKNYMF
jgi:hypothetical protein